MSKTGSDQFGELDDRDDNDGKSSRESSDALGIPATTQRALEDIEALLQMQDELSNEVASFREDPQIEIAAHPAQMGDNKTNKEYIRHDDADNGRGSHADENLFNRLNRRIDVVLQTGHMQGRFKKISVPEENPLRHLYTQQQSGISLNVQGGQAEASRFEVELIKDDLQQRFGFQCTRLKAGGDILVVTDIEREGLLDMWNCSRQRGDPRVQRFSVVQSVNGVEGDHVMLKAELNHTSIKMVIVNPPTVQDMVILCDAVRRPRAHPKPFWHSPFREPSAKASSNDDVAAFQAPFKVMRAGVSSAVKPKSKTSLPDDRKHERNCSETYDDKAGAGYCQDQDCQSFQECRSYADVLCRVNLGTGLQKT